MSSDLERVRAAHKRGFCLFPPCLCELGRPEKGLGNSDVSHCPGLLAYLGPNDAFLSSSDSGAAQEHRPGDGAEDEHAC